jgi:NitT/TauT family transport system substrate-binding protein/sulfonate transport system substrate-binding protein
MQKILYLIFALCAALPAAANDLLPIKIGAATATDHAPIFAAVEKGIFAKHGLDAKVVMYPTGVEMMNGQLSGAQDVSVLGTTPFLSGISKGFPLVLIAHLHGDALRDNYSDNVSLVASEASGLKKDDVKGLKGRRIALPRGSGAETFLLGHLDEAGLTLKDVTIVNSKPAELSTALANGDADAVVIWEPFASVAVAKVPGAYRAIVGGCPTCFQPGTVLTTRAVVEGKRDIVERFTAAFAESQQWVRQNFDAAAGINMHWIQGVDLAVMKDAIRRSHYDGRMSTLTPSMYIKNEIPTLAAAGRAKADVKVRNFIDPSFINAVQAKHPAFFSDLKPIPPALALK